MALSSSAVCSALLGSALVSSAAWAAPPPSRQQPWDVPYEDGSQRRRCTAPPSV
eukprot:CAMPEP_0171064230 /NCGR_PEP_ID=MMETSP0766_2-20121228/6154_1 /TAXON_ID=439317 /ORGANISM="Gambierdiscus australes, Strain CAWD 149" /LENGTH=53 /DNA_ID=CAMNT_0011520235 /DNA_START=324 /DNA_END=485 /DNA_ORIENTATION=-